MYPNNPEGTQVIVSSMKMGYDIFDTDRCLHYKLYTIIWIILNKDTIYECHRIKIVDY